MFMDELQITLQLQNIQELFDIPDTTPFSDDYKIYSNKPAINFVVEKLYAHRKSKNVLLKIFMPAEQIKSGLDKETEDAIKRYSHTWVEDSKQKMVRAKYKGMRGLATALVGLIFLNGTGILLSNYENFIVKLVSEGLIVAGWVLMWFPLDILTQEFWVSRLERNAYKKLEKIRVVIKNL